jgi:hypothetical protein
LGDEDKESFFIISRGSPVLSAQDEGKELNRELAPHAPT